MGVESSARRPGCPRAGPRLRSVRTNRLGLRLIRSKRSLSQASLDVVVLDRMADLLPKHRLRQTWTDQGKVCKTPC